MNDEAAPTGRPDAGHPVAKGYRLRRFATPSRRYSDVKALTPLQEWLVTAYLMLEDARDDLDPEAWRAFVWILTDRIGQEAAQLVVGEAVEAAEEAA
jgi:hypothetical protein